MGAKSETQVSQNIEVTHHHDLDAEKEHANIETGSIQDPEDGTYSKLSVWLMILFSGLAIGSDG